MSNNASIYANMGFTHRSWPRPPGNTVVKENLNCWAFGGRVGGLNKLEDKINGLLAKTQDIGLSDEELSSTLTMLEQRHEDIKNDIKNDNEGHGDALREAFKKEKKSKVWKSRINCRKT